ncbi:MAG: hypothetical protein ACYDDF_07980 [Thermoplasmatota archaeon]
MALWEYRLEFPDGHKEVRMLAAGNGAAAAVRAAAHAKGLGARVVGPVIVVDATKGSL